MLTDVELRYGSRSQRLSCGIYQSYWWNFELEYRSRQVYELDYPELGEFDCFGVCDSVKQLMTVLPNVVTAPGRKFVISMVEIRRDAQPSSGGWRWHKWGSYIGVQKSKMEYLYDEPEIDVVWTYHIYEVK